MDTDAWLPAAARATGRIHELLTELAAETGNLHRILHAAVPPAAEPVIPAATGPSTAAEPDPPASLDRLHPPDPIASVWAELAERLPDLGPLPDDGRWLALHHALWRITERDYERLHAAAFGPELGCLPPAGLDHDPHHPEAAPDDPNVQAITSQAAAHSASQAGGHRASLAAALPGPVSGILTIARTVPGLSAISVNAREGRWLTRLDAAAYRIEVLTALHKATTRAKGDNLVTLDAELRSVLPARWGPDGSWQILPPEPDSRWMALLDRSLAAVNEALAAGEPPLRAGHPARGVSMNEAEATAENRSLRQGPMGPGPRVVLWPLEAWLRTAEDKLVGDPARVVFGTRQPVRRPG